MRLKYKKAIILTTMSVMGIGILTLSVNNDKTLAQENNGNGIMQEAFADTEANSEEEILTSVTPTVTTAPTLTPLPVYDIEEDAYPDIQELFKKFYEAKNDRDVDAIKKLLSDPTKVDSQDELQKKTEYIEDYSDITTYTKKGYIEDTYIVYVYHEIKFTGISTSAPGLSKFYVVTGDDGKLKIFSGEMEEEAKAYYDARNNDEDVAALIDMTNKKSDEAIKSDEDLQSFWESINELANQNSDATDESAEDKTTDNSVAEGDLAE
jgi:hypothetical protein